MAPPYNTPPLPVASQYPTDAPVPPEAKAEARAAAEIGWRDYFADERLQGLIAQALENNRDLRLAVLRVLEARAAYQIQRADQFPTIGAGSDMFRLGIPKDFSTTGGYHATGFYDVGLTAATWELDFWGRVRNLKDAALEQFLATDDARRAVTVSLIAQVADTYLSLRELDERIAIARQTVRSREESFRILRRRFEEGSSTRLEVAQVQTLLTQAQALRAQLELERAAQAHGLTLLVGTPQVQVAGPAGLDDAAVMHELRVGLPSELLEQRPDIIAAEHRLRGANANIGAARAAFFPQITLTAFFGSASSELDNLFDSGTRAWIFAPRLFLPLFDAGRRQANLDLAQVRQVEAVTDYERTVQGAFRDVADALSAQRWLSEQVQIQRTAVAAQRDRSRLATLRYESGSSPYLEVLDAERDLLATEQQLVQTRRALLTSRVALYAALGGGSQRLGEPPDQSSPYDARQVSP